MLSRKFVILLWYLTENSRAFYICCNKFYGIKNLMWCDNISFCFMNLIAVLFINKLRLNKSGCRGLCSVLSHARRECIHYIFKNLHKRIISRKRTLWRKHVCVEIQVHVGGRTWLDGAATVCGVIGWAVRMICYLLRSLHGQVYLYNVLHL